jgi:hypothetical protein
MSRATPNGDMRECIEHCLETNKVCIATAMRHCLEAGGPHVEPDHFRLMVTCADICRTAADFMLAESEFRVRLCALCADVCDACADSCRDIGGMEECALACERCAASCSAMGATGRPLQTEPLLTHPKHRNN